MAWDARLKAAWRGEASGDDLAAMFAATAGLAGLKQALEDRRLEAEIEHTGHDWRAVLAVGRIAAPVWLADALVGLAGAFADAEKRAHPERSSVSRATFETVAALLAPVEDIIADVTAALADPSHRTALTAPLHVGPGGEIAGDDLAGAVPGPYAQGLAAGTRQLHTAAAAALAGVRTQIAHSESPEWLKAGLQWLDGELQGAGARLDSSEARLTALTATHAGDSVSLAAICDGFWKIVDVAAVAGQMIADPHLLPQAAGVTPRDADSDAARMQPVPTAPALPPPSPPRPRRAPDEFVDPLPLPRIDPGAAPLLQRRENSENPENPLTQGQGSSVTPAPQPAEAEVALPLIGEEPSQPRGPEPEPAPPRKAQFPARQKPETAKDAPGTDTPLPFPEIG